MRRAELRRSGRYTRVVTTEQPLPEDRPVDVPSGSASTAPAQSDSSRIIASMPLSDTMSRCWRFPDADEDKFRQMVGHRLEAELPVPIDELTWGYRMGPRRALAETPASPEQGPRDDGGAGGRRQVFAQAARSEQINQYMAMLSAANVRVDTLTTEAEAIGALYRHGLHRPRTDGTEVLVLATPDDWLVGVFDDGMVRSLRRIPIKPNRLDLACRQCEQSIEAEVSRRELGRVLWCGPAEQADVRNVLAERLGVTAEAVEPAGHLVDADGARIGAGCLATFGPAVGLALADMFESDQIIRLAAREEAEPSPHLQRVERILAHPWRWTAVAAGLLVLATAMHVGAIGCETRKMRALVDDLTQTGSPMTALQPKIRAMQRLQTYRIDVEALVADLCRPIPDSIVISSIALSRERRFVIKGTAKDPKAIFALADALRKSDRFAAVNPERTEPAQGGGFTISAELVGVKKLPSFAGRGRPWR